MKKNLGKIMTVNGCVLPQELGKTLPHEHLLFDFTCYLTHPKTKAEEAWQEEKITIENRYLAGCNPYANRDNCLAQDIDIPLEELKYVLEMGVKTIVDVTLEDFRRNVSAIKRISDRTGLNIVVATGNYLSYSRPEYIKKMSVDELAQHYIDEICTGIEKTGIRAGIIKLATGLTIDQEETKGLIAGAMAQLETGLPIMVHCHPPVHKAHQVLDILENAGADLTHCVMAHMDASLGHTDITYDQAMEYIASVALRGAFCEFDLCGDEYFFESPEASNRLPSDLVRSTAVHDLCLRGLGKNLLLSHDAGHKCLLRQWGGKGISHVFRDLKRMMLRAGVTEYDFDKITIDNPARMLTIR